MIGIQEVKNNNQQILNNYQAAFKSKSCTEIQFLGILDDKSIKLYNKYINSCCCLKPLFLLIYSFIVFIIGIVGIIFCLSNNAGYKAYKEYLETSMALDQPKFPNEDETVKLVELLNMLSEDDYYSTCNYIRYSLGFCSVYEYRQFCTEERYSENKCNYMDRQYYLGNNYQCTLGNYIHNRCSHIQYIDYKEQREGKDYEPMIEFDYESYIYTNGFSYQKFWCDISKHDFPIYLSFLILLFIFIVVLVFDVINRRKGPASDWKYYITLGFYLIYYFIFRIYIVLFLLLFCYSIVVCFTSPTTGNWDEQRDAFLDQDKIILNPAEKLWKDKRILGFVFCFINLLLFFMVMALSFYKKLFYDYITLKWDENNNNIIYRQTSIKIGNNIYNFNIKQNSNLYLMENIGGQKHIFKEIFYENNYYYLKFENLNIKDQLGWSDFDYPHVNELFSKLVYILKVMVGVSFFVIPLTFTEFKDEISYKYFKYLIDSGYQPKFYKYFKNSGILHELTIDFISTTYIITAIIFLLAIEKWALLGGFSNLIIMWINVFISLIITVLNLVSMILSGFSLAYNVIAYVCLSGVDIQFKNDSFVLKFFISFYLYFFIFFFALSLFIYCIKVTTHLSKIINDYNKLKNENSSNDDIYGFLALNNQCFLQAVNSDILPKNLFYIKHIGQIPAQNINHFQQENININNNLNITPYEEKNQDEIFDEKQKIALESYKTKYFNMQRIAGKILFQIIISGIIFVFLIVILSLSFKNNEQYTEYRDIFISLDESYSSIYSSYSYYLPGFTGITSILPGYTKFWCDMGDLEGDILISYLIFIILFILFEVFSFLMHKKKLQKWLKFDFTNNIFHNVVLLTNIAFYILFKIYVPILWFLFVYTIIAIVVEPDNNFESNSSLYQESFESIYLEAYKKQWDDNKNTLYANFVFKLFLSIAASILLRIKYSIIDYINMNYEEDKTKNNVGVNTKQTSITIKDQKYNVKVKLNEILYIKYTTENKIHKFKKIKIENVTKDFIYVKIGFNSITDQISLAQWNYPDINAIFIKLAELCDIIYSILFLSVPLFELHLKGDFNYDFYIGNDLSTIKKPIFNGIFSSYGSFEHSLTDSRFALYIIQICVLLLFMLKRIYFGGFSRPLFYLLTFIYSIILSVQNIIYVILDFLLILFSIFSLVSYYSGYDELKDDWIQAKLFLHFVINIIIFSISIKLSKYGVQFCKDVNRLRKELLKLINVEDSEDNEDIIKSEEIKYISLQGQIITLKAFNNELLQKNLYFYSEDNNNNGIIVNDYNNTVNSNQNNHNNININNENTTIQNNNQMIQIQVDNKNKEKHNIHNSQINNNEENDNNGNSKNNNNNDNNNNIKDIKTKDNLNDNTNNVEIYHNEPEVRSEIAFKEDVNIN